VARERIHHVGSTAIPGIAAKPVIDMIAGVRDFEEARAALEPLREQSYVSTPHRPGIAHHFSKPSAAATGTQDGLHLTEPGSDLWCASGSRSATRCGEIHARRE
jgi:GrpB-like predicted nucleotidyltransferase (UPF0157 family)